MKLDALDIRIHSIKEIISDFYYDTSDSAQILSY